MRVRQQALAAVVVAFALVAGAVVAVSADNTRGTLDSGKRTISFYNIHNKETLTSTFKVNGKYVPEEMKKINWILRDWRKDEPTTMAPALIDLLWEIHTELGSKAPIHIISGYRSRATNEMLRRTVGGQASQSRHILGKAADVHFPDVPLRMLRYSALIRQRGGVGYYPTSNIPFVHIDVDRPRAWPRLPRPELALLFPTGRTVHVPKDGGHLTPADARKARAKNTALAAQVDAFFALRNHPKSLVQTAALTPPLPKLLRLPQPAQRPAEPPAPAKAAGGATLASLSPELPMAPTVHAVERTAPASSDQMVDTAADTSADREDEVYPEELSYRPFPVARMLTATASPDDPALARLVHPDFARVLEIMDQRDPVPAVALRPGVHQAQRKLIASAGDVSVDLSLLDLDGAKPPRQKLAKQP